MSVSKWLANNAWDRSGLKRALRRVDEERRETKRQIEAAKVSGKGQPEQQYLKERRDFEEWDAIEDVEEILTRQIWREATKRHIAIPDRREDSPHWNFTNKAQWLLSDEERRRLKRIIRKERQVEWHLKLQVISVIGSILIGLLGVATAFVAILLQPR